MDGPLTAAMHTHTAASQRAPSRPGLIAARLAERRCGGVWCGCLSVHLRTKHERGGWRRLVVGVARVAAVVCGRWRFVGKRAKIHGTKNDQCVAIPACDTRPRRSEHMRMEGGYMQPRPIYEHRWAERHTGQNRRHTDAPKSEAGTKEEGRRFEQEALLACIHITVQSTATPDYS